MQFDHVARRVEQERLTGGADTARIAHLDTATSKLGNGGVEIGDLDGEVLAVVLGYLTLDQVDLLPAEIQPGATEREVGPVRSDCQAEHAGVELDAFGRIAHIDRHVMNPDRLHRSSLPSETLGSDPGVSGSGGVEQHATFGGGEHSACRDDGIGIDRDRRDAEPHQVFGERRVA